MVDQCIEHCLALCSQLQSRIQDTDILAVETETCASRKAKTNSTVSSIDVCDDLMHTKIIPSRSA